MTTITEILQTPVTFTLYGRVVPKARPRHTKNGQVYMPPNYVKWKDGAIGEIENQKLAPIAFSAPFCVKILFINSLTGGSDLDNAEGSILDAMVEAELISGDRVNIVKELSSEFLILKPKKKEIKKIFTIVKISKYVEPVDVEEYINQFLACSSV